MDKSGPSGPSSSTSRVDLNADFYIDHSELQHDLSQEVMERCVFNQTDTVLDIGCGDGRITAGIAHDKVPFGSVVGIDASENMIQSAQSKHPVSNYHNLSFENKRIEDFKTDERTFDKVVSFSCLHWTTGGPDVIKDMCRKLKDNGELLVLTYPKESRFYDFMEDALVNYPDYRDRSARNTMLSLNDYKQALEDSNVQVKDFEVKETYCTFSDESEVKSFIRGWLTSYVPLPEEFHDRFLEDALEKSKSYQVRSSGKIELPYTELIIHAKKL